MDRELSPLEQWYTVFASMGIAGIASSFELQRCDGARLSVAVLRDAVSRAVSSCGCSMVITHHIRTCPHPRSTLLAWYHTSASESSSSSSPSSSSCSSCSSSSSIQPFGIHEEQLEKSMMVMMTMMMVMMMILMLKCDTKRAECSLGVGMF
eukprot:TRINITY_DN6372_c0_g1_i1.p2 TRINITY_DN6372_c0_g1~~TRINITY_DN6372_c0_g1_i1.p2  ORF type:complete len:151 (-),score=47.05 TRINITY_DN6372_c0_g1_i1:189-641(-)